MAVFPVMAQRMHVEDFGRYKKPFLHKASFTTDKRQALLDFFTNEKGFQFFVEDAPVAATEGEEWLPWHCLTVQVPHYQASCLRATGTEGAQWCTEKRSTIMLISILKVWRKNSVSKSSGR